MTCAPRFQRGLRDRIAHLAGASIGDAAHRVYRLVGRACSDQNTFCRQEFGLEEGAQYPAPIAPPPASVPCPLRRRPARRYPAQAPARRRQSVARRCAVSRHSTTFRGSSPVRPSTGSCAPGTRLESRSSARPCASLAMKSALAGAITIASAARLRLMCAILFGTLASHWSVYTGCPESRLHRGRRDEMTRRLGHHDLHLDVLLDQQAHQFRRLVGRDTAGDAQDYPVAGCGESGFVVSCSIMSRILQEKTPAQLLRLFHTGSGAARHMT